MKKVTAFVGSARKKNTYKSVERFLKKLQVYGNVEYEIVRLSDYSLGICRGCFVCFEKGEEFCPLKDDRDVLMNKIMASDGVIFATPNYSFQLSGLMKVFLDRFGFAFHRPSYFGKAFTSIVTQGIGGGEDIVKYLDLIGNNLGFNTVKGISVTALDPRTEKDQQKIDRAIDELSKKYYATLINSAFPVPTMFKLMLFRMGRSTVREKLDDSSRDYRYYAEKGWFDSDYYYPTRLSLLKKVAGNFFDASANAVRNILA